MAEGTQAGTRKNTSVLVNVEERPVPVTKVAVTMAPRPDAGRVQRVNVVTAEPLGGVHTGGVGALGLDAEAHNPPPCGPTDKGSEGHETAQVSAGGDPAADLGLANLFSPLDRGEPQPDTEQDTFSDTPKGTEGDDHPFASEGKTRTNTEDSVLADRIRNVLAGLSGGHTVSEIRALLAAQDSEPDTLNQESVTRTMNRMKDRKELAKIGKGAKALYCLPEHEETVRAACRSIPEPTAPAQEPQVAKRFRFPKLQDIAMDLDEEIDEKPLSLSWPLGLERLVEVYPGNVIVLGGVTSTGKTAFLLDIARRNWHRHRILYFNSEMKRPELHKRLRGFEQHVRVPFDAWKKKVTFVPWKVRVEDERSVAGLLHYLDPHGVNLIDYLTVTEDFTKIAAVLDRIDEKLKDGIAIVAMQKDEKKKRPYGKLFTAFVTRLGMALDPSSCDKGPCVRLSFFKAKFPADENTTPEQVKIWFDIKGGAQITLKNAEYQDRRLKY